MHVVCWVGSLFSGLASLFAFFAAPDKLGLAFYHVIRFILVEVDTGWVIQSL